MGQHTYEDFDVQLEVGYTYIDLWYSLSHSKDDSQKSEIRKTMAELYRESQLLQEMLDPRDPFMVDQHAFTILANRVQRRNIQNPGSENNHSRSVYFGSSRNAGGRGGSSTEAEVCFFLNKAS